MLWLALRFASLPLEIYARAARSLSPIAIVGSTGSRAEIIACNDCASHAGVRVGMSVAAASALAADLAVVPRDLAAEQAALERIAAWAHQFTPSVSLAGAGEIVLEIEGSLGIFGGLQRLWREVTEGVRALGYAAAISCAPTPLAAQWFARARLAVRIRHADALRASLSMLPIEVMHAPPETFSLLQNVGAKSVSDVLALPREAFARRAGQALVDDLDRALGRLPDPRLFFTPPARFTASQALPAPAHEAEMLLFAARRLLIEFCGCLSATAQGVQRLTFTFSHHGVRPTRLTLTLVAATRDAEHLTNVLRERLERTRLPCAATDLALESELLVPLGSRNLCLIQEPQPSHEAAAQLIERLCARVGDDAVVGLKRIADHRPEYAWATCAPGSHDTVAASVDGRPLWLLGEPHVLTEEGNAPCYQGRLTLLAGPERIESGWWDGRDVTRDYFVATNPAETLLWIFRERDRGGRWFLHGFFG